MSDAKFKVIILTHGGAADLLEELSAVKEIEIAGIFVETVTERQRPPLEKLRRSIKYDGLAETAAKILRSFNNRKNNRTPEIAELHDEIDRLKIAAEKLSIPYFEMENYHLPASINKMQAAGADLGIIYGTNIVREAVFSIPRLGSINLHQGHAPYYRGGPTVFWELMNGENQLGITIHFVAAKVDTGDIVKQELIDLRYDLDKYGLEYESFLADFRADLVKPSAALMSDAVKAIACGNYERIKQDISLGKRYRIPTKKEKDRLKMVLKKRFKDQQPQPSFPGR